MKTEVNVKSIKRRNSNTGAQIKLTTADGAAHWYACQSCVGRMDKINIFSHSSGSWQRISDLDEATIQALEKSISLLDLTITPYCTLKDQDSKGEYRKPYRDSYMYSSKGLNTVTFKLGDFIVHAVKSDDGQYCYKKRPLSDLSEEPKAFKPKDYEIERIARIMNIAQQKEARYQREIDSQPIGFKSKADMANHLHSVGVFAQSHRQYTRSKRA